MTELFADQKADLPEEWHETFDALTAQGKSPSGILATIEYVTTDKSQREVSKECNVSTMTIRTLQSAVIALGPVDEKQAAQHGSGRRSAIDYCNHVADHLGWDEGVEYGVSASGYGKTQQPRLRSEGWRALYELVCEADGADEGGGGEDG